MKSFFKVTRPLLPPNCSGAVNWPKPGNWSNGYDSLFLWFRLDIYSIDLELFGLCKPSKNLAFHILEHYDQLASAIGLHESGYSNCCFDSAIYYGNYIHLAFGGWVLPLGPCHPRTQSLQLHLGSPIPWLKSHCEFWLTETSNHRVLQGCWSSLTNLFLIVLVRSMSSGPSQCVSRLKWQIQTNIPISLSLWIPFYILNHGRLAFTICSLWAMFWPIFQPTN